MRLLRYIVLLVVAILAAVGVQHILEKSLHKTPKRIPEGALLHLTGRVENIKIGPTYALLEINPDHVPLPLDIPRPIANIITLYNYTLHVPLDKLPDWVSPGDSVTAIFYIDTDNKAQVIHLQHSYLPLPKVKPPTKIKHLLITPTAVRGFGRFLFYGFVMSIITWLLVKLQRLILLRRKE